MTISFTIDLSEMEQFALKQRLERLGLTVDQWAQQVVTIRIDAITSPHKMAQARELFDKFQSAPESLKKQLMNVQGSGELK